MIAHLEENSLLLVYAAMAVLAISLLAYTFELSRVASVGKDAAETGRLHRIGTLLLGLAVLALGGGVVLRGIAAERVPWANMYEFSITAAFIMLGIYLMSIRVRELRFIAALVTGFGLLTLGAATTLFYVPVKSLMPALQSYWLVIHVIVAVLATAFFNIAAALHATHLIKEAGWMARIKGKAGDATRRIMEALPTAKTLEQVAYRFNIIGFVLWTFTLIAGAIWAERAWHRYWGWDTKEVWTFIIWVLYAGYLHAMATRGWNGKRAAWLGLVAFSAIIFNFVIVNQYFKGLHVYSGL